MIHPWQLINNHRTDNFFIAKGHGTCDWLHVSPSLGSWLAAPITSAFCPAVAGTRTRPNAEAGSLLTEATLDAAITISTRALG